MLKDQDIIFFSATDWDYVYARPQHVVNRILNNNNVLYVEATGIGIGSVKA